MWIGGVNPGSAERTTCARGIYERELLPTNLLLVVDRSGSMICNLPHITPSMECEEMPHRADPAQPSKWELLGGTLSTTIDQLARIPNTAVGLAFFSVDDVCGVSATPSVPLARLTGAHADALKSSLRTVEPRGGTPLVGSVVAAYRHLHNQAQAPGNRFVVLITDGEDSCLGERYAQKGVPGDQLQMLLDVEMPKALSVNVRTFVIGVPGSEFGRAVLSKMAWAGGTARSADCDHAGAARDQGDCHFDTTTSSDLDADLTAAFASITGQTAATCELTLPAGDGEELDLGAINVDYLAAGTERVPLVRDDTAPCDEGADGWQFAAENERVRICGPACDAIRLDEEARVEIEVGCEQRIR